MYKRQVGVARRRDRLDEIAARLRRVEVLAADLTTAAGLASVEERIAAGGKDKVDLVVNNAGFGTSGEFYLLDADRLAEEVELNVIALTRLSRAALGVMAVSYTHLRAHETVLDLVCLLLL